MLPRKRPERARQENIQDSIRTALELILPILRIEDCEIRLSSFDLRTGVALLDVRGGCPDCSMPVTGFLAGIESQVKLRVPEVKSVRLS